MKRISLVVLVLALALVALPASADVTVKTTISATGGPGGMEMTSVVFVKGMKMRTDTKVMGQDMSILVDVATKQMLMINHVSKEVSTFDPKAMAGQMPVTMGEVTLSVKPTGETKEVLGRKCAGYTVQVTMPMTLNGESVTMTLSGPAWITKEGPGVEEYMAYSKAAAAANLVSSPFSMGPQSQGMTELMKTFAEAGVPLAQEMQMAVQGTGQMAQMMSQMAITMTTKVTEITTDPIPDDKFAIPAGYTKK
jgi:hypothetical protein